MRTVNEEETREIAKIIQEFGEKLYSKNGAKFVQEAKKFLNQEPCWVEKENEPNDFNCRGASILAGGQRGRVAIIGNHVNAGLSLNISRELADFPWEFIEQLNCRPGLLSVIECLREEFGPNVLGTPLEIIAQLPRPFIIRRLGEDYIESVIPITSRKDSKQNKLRANNHSAKASKPNLRSKPRINRKK